MAGSKNIHVWSEEEKEFLKQITPGHHYNEIHKQINEQFDLDLTLKQIKGAISRNKLNTGFTGQFKKGHKTWNTGLKGVITGGKQTQFKKGNRPANWVPIGTERINGDGYTDVKIADGKKQKNWKGKHIIIWEELNGPIPDGHVVMFGDGNKHNFALNNLILVSRQQLAMLNKGKLIQKDSELTKTAIIMVELNRKISERKAKAK